jgi:hypothetical protein
MTPTYRQNFWLSAIWLIAIHSTAESGTGGGHHFLISSKAENVVAVAFIFAILANEHFSICFPLPINNLQFLIKKIQ